MSRSRKKHPITQDGGRSKKSNRTVANRKVRRILNGDPETSLSHRKYKRAYCSYDICDQWCYWSKAEAIAEYEKHKKRSDLPGRDGEFSRWVLRKYPTLKSWLISWYKDMIRK